MLVACLLLAALVSAIALRRAGAPVTSVAQDRPGPVLLVPGYGGSTAGLDQLAARLRAAGRDASLLRLGGDGTGDLREQADLLATTVDALVAGGAPSVDVVGFSAGGVTARIWAADRDGATQARRVVALGAPHHGSEVAALASAFVPGSCPAACRQLVPGSDLLSSLNQVDETPEGPRWVTIWTEQDTVVTPPDSARLDGAVDISVQQLCPGRQVAHGQLPTDEVVTGLVLRALAVEEPTQPRPVDCSVQLD